MVEDGLYRSRMKAYASQLFYTKYLFLSGLIIIVVATISLFSYFLPFSINNSIIIFFLLMQSGLFIIFSVIIIDLKLVFRRHAHNRRIFSDACALYFLVIVNLIIIYVVNSNLYALSISIWIYLVEMGLGLLLTIFNIPKKNPSTP